MTNIPVTIMIARLNAGLTQKQLGEMCGYKVGYAQRYVSGWESGVRPVPKSKIILVGKILNIDPLTLL